MRPVLAMLATTVAFGVGCIAAEPGAGTDSTSSSRRNACEALEGLSFVGPEGQVIAFAPDDLEYTTYTETAADGTSSIGLVQCLDAGYTFFLFTDGATDRWSARADISFNPSLVFLTWTTGQMLTSPHRADGY